MIKILKQNDQLLFIYTPDDTDFSWIDNQLQHEGKVTIRRFFKFGTNRLVEESDTDQFFVECRTFILGISHGNYFKIDSDILGIKNDLLLSKDMTININTFVANRDISVFRKIDSLINEQIVIGGNIENAIPTNQFQKMLRNFPTSTELTHYSHARIERVLKDYLGTMSDAQKKLDDFLNRKKTIKAKSRVVALKKYEQEKYEFVRSSFIEMLKEIDNYSEDDWQKLIVALLLLIFPKYIAVLEKVQIKDYYSCPGKTIRRCPDLTLIDANGNIDIIEIKKPFSNCILSSKYRDNYAPHRELSGAVMQVEKYLFHLNKWGLEGERILNQKWGGYLPSNLQIKRS